MEGSPGAALHALPIQGGGGSPCVRIEANHRVEPWPTLIVRLDSGEIGVYEADRRHETSLHRLLHLGDRRFGDLEALGLNRRRHPPYGPTLSSSG